MISLPMEEVVVIVRIGRSGVASVVYLEKENYYASLLKNQSMTY